MCTCTGACEAASKLTHRTLGGHQHVLSAMLVLITRCLLAMMHTILQRIGNKNRKMYAVAAFPFSLSLVSLSLSLSLSINMTETYSHPQRHSCSVQVDGILCCLWREPECCALLHLEQVVLSPKRYDKHHAILCTGETG